jgi:hypothetical protein
MTEHRPHWLIRLYPRKWRERYGAELDELLGDERGWRAAVDVARFALIERLFHPSRTGAQMMREYPNSVGLLVRKPSAIVPIIMSAGALAVVVVAFAVSGLKNIRQPDEGTAAHLWQLLMAGQLPFLAWFALNWIRRDLKAGLSVLALQLVLFAAAVFPIWYFGL